MALLDYNAYTRSSLDSDDSELPDDLLEVWCLEALYRVRAALSNASSGTFTMTGPLTVVANQAAYPMTSAELSAFEEVRAITNSHWMLERLEHETAEQFWQHTQADDGDEFRPTATGTPSHWSVYASETDGAAIYLWPPPSTSEVYQVRGFTKLDVETFGVATVVPAEVQPLIGEYMVARGAEMQQNISLAAVKFNRFEAELDVIVKRVSRGSTAGITTIGGAKFRGPRMTAGRLPFSWE